MLVDVRRRRDGALVEMDVALGPLHAADGSVVGVTRILHDRAGHGPAWVEGLAAQQHLFQGARPALLGHRDRRRRAPDGSPTHPVGRARSSATTRRGAEHLAWSVLHPADAPGSAEVVQRVVATSRERTERFVVRVRDNAGPLALDRGDLTNCLTDPEIRRLVANLRDITEQVQTEEAAPPLRGAAPGDGGDRAGGDHGDGPRRHHHVRERDHGRDPRAARWRALNGPDCTPARPGAAGRGGARPARVGRGPERFETTYAHPDGRERDAAGDPQPAAPPGGPETLGWLSLVSDVTEARRVERSCGARRCTTR